MKPGNAVRLGALAAIWGSSFLWIELALRDFSPIQITFARLAIGAAVLVAFIRARGLRLPRGRLLWAELAFAALVSNVLPYTLYGIGQRSVDSTVAGAINATTPLFTLAIALAVGTAERLDRRAVVGLLVGFAGTVLLLEPWQSGASLKGSLLCLAAAALYGVAFIFMSRRLVARGMPPLILAAGQLVAATALTAAAMPVLGTDGVQWTTKGVVALAALGLGSTGIAYVLNYRLVADEGPTAASTVTYLMPVVATALGALALGEDVGPQLIGGMAVVLLGVGLVQRRRKEAVGAPVAPPPPAQQVTSG